MWARVLVLVSAAGGCVFVPRTEYTSTFVTSEVERVVPPAAAMGVEVTSTAGTITLRASEPRVCLRETWDVTDVKHDTSVGFEALFGNDDVSVLLAIIAAPVTLPVSGFITLLIVLSDKGSVTRERHRVATTPYECPVLRGNVPITLVLPSGTSTQLTTNGDGIASFTVPAEEPDAGVIAVNVEALGPRQVRYDRARATAIVDKPPPAPQTPADKRAACIEQRRQLMLSAQQISDAKERGRLLQALPVCPAK